MTIQITDVGTFSQFRALNIGDTFVFADEPISKDNLKVKCVSADRLGYAYLDSDSGFFYSDPIGLKIFEVHAEIKRWN